MNFLLTSHHWLGGSTQLGFFKSKNAKDATKERGLWMYLDKNVGTPIQPSAWNQSPVIYGDHRSRGATCFVPDFLEALKGVRCFAYFTQLMLGACALDSGSTFEVKAILR